MTLPIAYFPPISWFLILLRENAEIEAHENYVKQTLRNRCQIATVCGVQNLSLPIVRSFSNNLTIDATNSRDFKRLNSRLITNIRISSHDNWHTKHWHAIETAYGESAFFDYYADDLKPFFESSALFRTDESQECLTSASQDSLISEIPCSNSELFLFRHNVKIIKKLLQLMDIDHELRFTKEFAASQSFAPPTIVPPYYQVFREKQGFISDLSILDLLFNIGPESACYLLKGNVK